MRTQSCFLVVFAVISIWSSIVSGKKKLSSSDSSDDSSDSADVDCPCFDGYHLDNDDLYPLDYYICSSDDTQTQFTTSDSVSCVNLPYLLSDDASENFFRFGVTTEEAHTDLFAGRCEIEVLDADSESYVEYTLGLSDDELEACTLVIQESHVYQAVCGANPNATNTQLTLDLITTCMTLEAVREHQLALQEIADANDGQRASGYSGYDESVAYIVAQLEAAGYTYIEQQSFDFTLFSVNDNATLIQLIPSAVEYTYLVDFTTMTYSGSGTATAMVKAVDFNSSTSGCDEDDFDDFPAGNIALIQRGGCYFVTKVELAEAAGASGVIIFNDGAAEDGSRDGLMTGSLSMDYTGNLPAVFATYQLGVEWATSEVVMSLTTDTTRTQTSSVNLLAETTAGDEENVVMVGAHLDSVAAGPGINDNGSGSAAILEAAIQMANVDVTNKLRFAWWAAEEIGLIGSTYYVEELLGAANNTGSDILNIALYLNFDMIGSPNYVFHIYDGDNSDGNNTAETPDGSAVIEAFFESFFAAANESYKGSAVGADSDHFPFTAAGVPVGGLFTGASAIKTEEEAEIWGGDAGQAMDPCYHQPCDDYDNNNDHALDVNADAVAAATLYYAMSTEDLDAMSAHISAAFQPAAMNMITRSDGQREERLGHFYIS